MRTLAPSVKTVPEQRERLQCMTEDVQSSVLRHSDVERTSGDVLVTPLHDQDVAALFLHRVRHVVHPAAHVFDVDLLTGRLRPMDADHQHVGSCFAAVDRKRVLLTDEGL